MALRKIECKVSKKTLTGLSSVIQLKGESYNIITQEDVMLVNDNFANSNTKLDPSKPHQVITDNQDIADYIRGMATDLERLSQQAGMIGVAACLRAAVSEARRVKNEERLLKLGVTPDRRLG